jgi:hypothetical protein
VKGEEQILIVLNQRTAARRFARLVVTAAVIGLYGMLGGVAQAQNASSATAATTRAQQAQAARRATARVHNPEAAPGTVFVKTALGGSILGYDIDQNGTEGVLSEFVQLQDGKVNAAVETFDQTTGKILKVVSKQKETHNDFVTFGIFGNSVGLVEEEKSSGIFVDKRLYATMNPLSGNKFTGKWTPTLTKDQRILGLAASQGSPNTVVLTSLGVQDATLFSSNIADNTFGPMINVTNGFFGFGNPPAPGLDTVTNQALIAGGNGAFMTHPTLAEVDLTTQNVTEFQGLGFGFVNGIAVDSADGIGVTTTEDDFSIEFYNLATQAGFTVLLHNATSQAQSGQSVEFDPVNKLFLVEQEFSSTAPSGSSIQVFDVNGNFIEAINGLNLPASPTLIALNPSKRIGFVLVTPALTELQSFTY